MAYVYDPSASISESFSKSGQAMGEIFANIVAQKQKEFQFGQNLMQNIDNLRSEVSKYGDKESLKMVSDLTKFAGGAIFKDGKLAYENLGKIKEGINQVKDYVSHYEIYKQGVDQYAKIAAANQGELESPSAFMRDVLELGSDFDSIKSGDINAKLSDIYVKHSSEQFKLKQKVNSFANYTEIQVPGEDAQGNLVTAKINVPQGVSYDTKTGKYLFSEEFDNKFYSSIKSDPEMMMFLRKKSGVSPEVLPDNQMLDQYKQMVVGPAGIQINKLKQELDILKFESTNEFLKQKFNNMRTDSNYKQALANKSNLEAKQIDDLLKYDPSQNVSRVTITIPTFVDKDGKKIPDGKKTYEGVKLPLQKPVETDLNIQTKDGRVVSRKVKITSIATVGKGDKFYVTYNTGEKRSETEEIEKDQLRAILNQNYLTQFKDINKAQQELNVNYILGDSSFEQPSINNGLPALPGW